MPSRKFEDFSHPLLHTKLPILLRPYLWAVIYEQLTAPKGKSYFEVNSNAKSFSMLAPIWVYLLPFIITKINIVNIIKCSRSGLLPNILARELGSASTIQITRILQTSCSFNCCWNAWCCKENHADVVIYAMCIYVNMSNS